MVSRAVLWIALAAACPRADAQAPPPARIARWSDKAMARPAPGCVAARDRFIQYAELDGGALRMCLWWNLGKAGFPDVGCWRVDLATGRYDGQGGVWFSSPQPARVGLGGGLPRSSSAVSTRARWGADKLELCREAACKRAVLPRPVGIHEEQVVFDDAGQLAVVPLGARDKAHAFATFDVASGAELAIFSIPDRHAGAEAVGFAGRSLVVTDCDDRSAACTWELYAPLTGMRIAAVGGDKPLGDGGTAVMLDAHRFAAVAGTHLVVQDAETGEVTARLELPRSGLDADDVAFFGDAGLVVASPDARVLLVDPATATIKKTIAPPRCAR